LRAAQKAGILCAQRGRSRQPAADFTAGHQTRPTTGSGDIPEALPGTGPDLVHRFRSPPPRAGATSGDALAQPGEDSANDGDSEPRAEPQFDLLYREQAPQLRRRVHAQLRSKEEASDLVQDAFARLLGSTTRHALRQPEAFLNRIVRNLLVDRARRLATRTPHVPIDGNEPATRPTQADAIELAQMKACYEASVAALPARMREVFLLHRVRGLSYQEIAAQLGIGHRTVAWHIAEAIVRIGRDLEP
jgi:RNA polymerase sigma factor (sigma-70 family)